MDKMQSLFHLLVPKHPTQRYFGYRRQKPAQAGRWKESDVTGLAGHWSPPSFFPASPQLSACPLSFPAVAQHHPLPGSWLLPLSVTSPFTGWVPASGPGQGELFSPGGANLLHLPHPLSAQQRLGTQDRVNLSATTAFLPQSSRTSSKRVHIWYRPREAEWLP